MATKQCTKCLVEKPLETFAKNRGRKDGYGTWCKECMMAHYYGERITEQQCSLCQAVKPRNCFRWNPKFGLRSECLECEKTWLRCSVCGEVKTHDSFPPSKRMSTGRHGTCNECHAQRMSDKYENDPEHRKRHKQYGKTPKARAYQREYANRPEVKKRVKQYNREYGNWKYHNDPERKRKHKARMAVNLALAYGLIKKPERCQSGGKYGVECSGTIEGHHHKGYGKEHWLDVEWLCVACHKAADAHAKEQS